MVTEQANVGPGNNWIKRTRRRPRGQFCALLAIGLSLTLAGCGDSAGTAESAEQAQAVAPTIDYAANAQRLQRDEFQPSTLSADDQLAELAWFTEAAGPFRGMEIKVVSEALTTHAYESEVLAKAFYDITGIKVTHDLLSLIHI